jgi:hypothetical protein
MSKPKANKEASTLGVQIVDGEETEIKPELYVADGHSIGAGLWQYYWRVATLQEVKERLALMEAKNEDSNLG